MQKPLSEFILDPCHHAVRWRSLWLEMLVQCSFPITHSVFPHKRGGDVLRPVLSVPQCFLPVLQCPQSMLVSLSTHFSFLLMPHFNHQHFSMHSDHFMWLTSMVTAESEFSLQFIFYMLSVFQTARSLQAFGLRLREYMNEMFSPKQHLSLSTFTFNGKLFCNKPPDWLSSLPVCSI